MIAAFVQKNLQATIERLNRREIFSCEFYQVRNMDAAKKSVEDGGSFSHIIFDIAYFDGDIDAGLELLSRFSATTTAIMIVVNDDVNFGLAVKQEALKRGVKPSNIISGTGAAFGKALLEILIRDHVVIDDATSVPEDIPTVSETTLVASEFPGPVTALPASAKDNVSIAVAGAGAGVGCTTQAMQILLYLRSQSVDAALVEMVSRHSLSEYDGIMEDENYEIVDEIHIRVCGSDIYLGSQSVTKARAQHSYLVYDYGNYEGIPDVSTYLEKDIRVVVGSTKPWEMGHLNGVFAADDGSIYYVFTFVPAGDQQAVRMQMADAASKTFFSSYAPDYFNFCGNENLYRGIVGNVQASAAPSRPHKKRWFLFK